MTVSVSIQIVSGVTFLSKDHTAAIATVAQLLAETTYWTISKKYDSLTHPQVQTYRPNLKIPQFSFNPGPETPCVTIFKNTALHVTHCSIVATDCNPFREERILNVVICCRNHFM